MGITRIITLTVILLAESICLSATPKQSKNLFVGKLPNHISFQETESLSYEVNWKPLFLFPSFKAGELSFSINISEYKQTPTYTISAWAISEGPLMSVASLKIKNYFESTVGRKDFRSLRLLKKTHQNKKQRHLEVLFDYDKKSTHIQEIDPGTDPPKTIRNQTIEGIPGLIADSLSVFYLARLRSLMPGEKYFIYFSESGKIKKIHVVVEQQEKVTTNIGVFNSIKISTTGGLFKGGGDFRIWYSTDQLRIPVRFEANVLFGKIYGKIIRLESPKRILGTFKTSSKQ